MTEKSGTPPTVKNLLLSTIRQDGGTQPREAINDETVTDYAEAMQAGAEFPPLIVFYDGSVYWLADGFHRARSYQKAARTSVTADVRQGTRRDAVLFSVGANAAHGLRRTNDDKRRAVQTLLSDDEWKTWSDREIARRCNVDGKTVAAVKECLGLHLRKSADSAPSESRKVERGGKVYEQKSGNINKDRATKTPAATSPPKPDETAEAASTQNTAREFDDDEQPAETPTTTAVEVAQPHPDDLTDEEWLNSLPIWRVLQSVNSRLIMRVDLLSYRTMEELKTFATFAKDAKRSPTYKEKGTTPLSKVISPVVNLRHPREWHVCAPCRGRGCTVCGYAGYDLVGAGIAPARVEKGEVKL